MKALIFVIGILAGGAMTVFAAENSEPPYLMNAVELNLAEWRETPAPALWSEQWRAYNQTAECYVFERDGKILVAEFTPGNRFEYCIDGGCFNGFNKGEFGGELHFKPRDAEEYRVLYCNPVAIFALNGRYYLLEGLAHLDVAKGSIYVLEHNGARYEAHKLQDLKAAPHAVLVENDAAFILLDKKLVKWRLEENKPILTPLAETEFLFALYPHTMLRQNTEIIIGARGGIAVYNEKNGAVKWFVKP